MKKTITQKEKGVSIYLALVILVILLVTTFGLVDILLKQKKTTQEIDLSAIALGAANAGIEHIFYLDKQCIEDSTFCTIGDCNGAHCCKPDCSGLMSGIQIQGTTSVPNSSDFAEYTVKFSRNCGINTATSTGSYKGVTKMVSTSFGTSLIGPHLNSATDSCNTADYYTCNEVCADLDCDCYSVGTNTSTAPGADNREVVIYNTTTHHCEVYNIPLSQDACSVSKMFRSPECGIVVPPPSQENCPSTFGEVHPTNWTYCYCTGTSGTSGGAAGP